MSSSLNRQSTPPQPPRHNFPLPRELRDVINGHLVAPEQVEYPRPPCYQTNILAVNRTIGGEAAEAMYDRQTFVVISHRLQALDDWMDDFSVPVLSRSNMLSNYPHYSMRLTIRDRGRDKKKPTRWMLLLAIDLPKFTSALRWYFFSLKQSVDCVIEQQGGAAPFVVRPNPADFHDFHLEFEVRSIRNAGTAENINKDSSMAFFLSLLWPFEACIYGGMNVTVCRVNALEGSRILLMHRIMGPRQISLVAMAWSFLTAWVDLKALLHLHLERREYDQVHKLVSAAIAAHKASTVTNLDPQHYNARFSEIHAKILAILLDCTVLSFVAYVRQRDIEGAVAFALNEQVPMETAAQWFHATLGVHSLPVYKGSREPFVWQAHLCWTLLPIVEGHEHGVDARDGSRADLTLGKIIADVEDWSGKHLYDVLHAGLSSAYVRQEEMGLPDRTLIGTYGAIEVLRYLGEVDFSEQWVKTDSAYRFAVPGSIEGWVDLEEQPREEERQANL